MCLYTDQHTHKDAKLHTTAPTPTPTPTHIHTPTHTQAANEADEE